MDQIYVMSKLFTPPKLSAHLIALLLVSGLFAVSSAHAEDEAGEESAQPQTPQEAMTKDLALFWGNKREVKVIQRRIYKKEGKMEATLHGGIIPNDDFLIHYLMGASFGYYFTESMMVEGSFTYAIDENSGLSDYLKNSEIGLKEALIREFIQYYYNVSLLWSPIYGKFSFLGTKLAHFNFYAGLGLGLVHTEGYEDEVVLKLSPQTKPAFNGILGFRWHLSQMFSLRTEYRHFVFEQIGGGGMSTPISLNLALSASF